MIELTDDESTDLIFKQGDLDVPLMFVHNGKFCADSRETVEWRSAHDGGSEHG